MEILSYAVLRDLLRVHPARAEIAAGAMVPVPIEPDELRAYLEAGGWHGLPVEEPGARDTIGRNEYLFALALFRFGARYPQWDQLRLAGAAGQLAHLATGWSCPYPIEEQDPRWAWTEQIVIRTLGGSAGDGLSCTIPERLLHEHAPEGMTPEATAALVVRLVETLYALDGPERRD